jgi:hypothetical protein
MNGHVPGADYRKIERVERVSPPSQLSGGPSRPCGGSVFRLTLHRNGEALERTARRIRDLDQQG